MDFWQVLLMSSLRGNEPGREGKGGRGQERVLQMLGVDAPETYVVEFRVPAGGPVAESRTVFLPAGETLDMGEVAL